MALEYVDIDRTIEELTNAIDVTKGTVGTESTALGKSASANGIDTTMAGMVDLPPQTPWKRYARQPSTSQWRQ